MMLERFVRHIGYGNMVIEWNEVAWLDNDFLFTTDINKRKVFPNRAEAENALAAIEQLISRPA